MSEIGRRRVVITGVGALTPIGNTADAFWDAALRGENGITRLDRFETSDLSCQIAATIKNFDPTTIMDAREAKKTDRFVHYALAACFEAWKQSGIDVNREDPYRIGVILGSGIGGLEEIEAGASTLFSRGPSRVSPFFIPKLMLNAGSGQVAIHLGLRGSNYSCASACASANNAVGTALRLIQYGDADVMISGGSEATITRLGMAGFCSARAMATNRNDSPDQASRPFDKDRSGFVMGEGAGALVLEELAHARARGAKILCEIVGYGATDDAYHITAPSENGEGAAACMRFALKDARLNPEDISYINAHGTSTEYNDRSETKAIRAVFGNHANQLAVSSTKSMIGHLLGASGAPELVACVKSLETGNVHPTRNYTTPDPDCDLDYIPREARQLKVRAVLKNSFGFGGHNATIVLKRFEG